jgi:hypothetical protein
MWYLPDYPTMSPVIMINTRSQIKATQTLFERIDMRKVPSYTQLWELGIVQDKGAEGPYFNISYRAAGYLDDYSLTEQLYNKYEYADDWAANDESEREDAGNGKTINENMASKF